MYRLSKDTDLSFLLEAEMLQVCIGSQEVILNFDRRVRVTILSDFTVTPSGAPPTVYQKAAIGGVALLPLLRDTIVAAAATEQGGLSLTFRSGTCLEVHDTSDQFESFWISDDNHQIIV